jgi:hypothetical protein
LEKAQHLKIKKSTLPNAGMGLFTTIKRKAGDKIAPYDGKTVLSNDPDYGGAYILQVKKNPPTFIDAAATTSGAGRFSNMAKRGQGGNNAKLAAWFTRGGAHASIKAGKTINPGKEVLTNYGADYWK